MAICFEFGHPVWQAPLQKGQITEAWPLDSWDTKSWGYENRLNFVSEDLVLEVEYPMGSINPGNPDAPEGGLGFLERFTLSQAAAGCLSYQVRFQKGFDFALGGKLPGLWGGKHASGCTEQRDQGFSTRFGWGRSGFGHVYVYKADRQTRCGEVFVDQNLGMIRFQPGKWLQLDQFIVLNTPGKSDGVLKVWADNILKINRHDVAFRESGTTMIDGLMFSTFFGGNSQENASPKHQKAWFRRFEYRAIDNRICEGQPLFNC